MTVKLSFHSHEAEGPSSSVQHMKPKVAGTANSDEQTKTALKT